MIYRIARAMAEGDRHQPHEWLEPYPSPSEIQEHYLNLARIAIEAMREPTEGMINAGWGEIGLRRAWQAMISAALKGDE